MGVIGLVVGCGGGTPAVVDAPRAVDARIVDTPVDTPIDGENVSAWSFGAIDIAQSPMGYRRAFAVFSDSSTQGTVTGTNGPCVETTSAPDSGQSAGTLAVTGTTAALSLVPSGAPPLVHYDPQVSPPSPLFVAGAMITVTAPTFTINAVAPDALAGFVPPTTAISRAAGYTTTWTADNGSLLEVALETGSDELTCTVPDTGSYTVEPASLALLPTGATSVTVVVARVAHVSLAMPNVTLDVASLIPSQSVGFGP
jgi:hypothetical protein